MKYPCNFSLPISWEKYSRQHPWRQTLERCRKQLKGGGVLEEFGRIPGFSERTMRSILFEEDFAKDKKMKCKCGDAWTTHDHDHLGSLVPFSINMIDKEPLSAEELLLQQLMKKLGFLVAGGEGDSVGLSEKELTRRWLDELNKFYNLRNNNDLKHGKRQGKKYELNYLDYSLLKYKGIDDTESELDMSEEERKRRRNRKPPAELTGDIRSDINHMQFRLRSITKTRKTNVEALLFYSPFVKQNDGDWKSFNPEGGSVALRAKLFELGCNPEFSDWAMKAMDYIIRGDPIPTNVYDINRIRELRQNLGKLLIRKPKPVYDFFGFQINKRRRRR